MQLISNASPLILLAKLDALYLLKNDAIIITPIVQQELFAKESLEKDRLIDFCKQKNLSVQTPKKIDSACLKLHAGEQEVISLALEKNIQNLLLDDRRARAIAKLKKLAPKGTLWIISRALHEKQINKKTAKNLLYDLPKSGFRIDERLLLEAIKTIDNYS